MLLGHEATHKHLTLYLISRYVHVTLTEDNVCIAANHVTQYHTLSHYSDKLFPILSDACRMAGNPVTNLHFVSHWFDSAANSEPQFLPREANQRFYRFGHFARAIMVQNRVADKEGLLTG